MKALNLYCGIGGNRKKWPEDVKVTAVEYREDIAAVYRHYFPQDTVIVGDAHEYLLNHYQEFDFIWTSRPCTTHSRANFWASRNAANRKKYYPDFGLYQEITFLRHWFDGQWVAENVIPYYEPLIPAQKRGRHLYWTNFKLPNDVGERQIQIGAGADEVKRLCDFHRFNFYQYKGEQRIDKIARNLVDYEVGKTIFNIARGILNHEQTSQLGLFNNEAA